MKSLTHVQQGFSGGVNALLDTTLLRPDEYRLLVNGRTRFGKIQPIRKPLLVEDGLPAGNFQGCYSVGNFGIVFVSGQAFYKDYSAAGSGFLQIPGFQLSATAPVIYAQAVPASTVNYVRKAGASANQAVTFGNTLTGSPQAFVVQDGESQPWIIFSDGTSRILKNYNEWSVDDREYVPVGTLMAFVNGILYVVSGKQIYRSVSGRPLDFVIAIDANGDKISNLEVEGGAIRGVFYIGLDDITAMIPNGTDAGGLIVSTRRATHFVLPNTAFTIYGEPTFDIIPLFNTGGINQFAYTDILGDVAFVDLSGIRSFNAIQQLKNEGRNSPLSLKVASLLQGIEQSTVAAGSYDNYDFFALQTVHGPAVLVYDELIQNFSALDIYENVGLIKQFALIKTSITTKLIFITVDNKFYEAFDGDDVEEVGFFFGERGAGDPKLAQDPVSLKLLFTDVLEQGIVEATPYTDEKAGSLRALELEQVSLNRVTPTPLPFDSVDDTVKPLFFSLKDTSQLGHKVGCWIRWKFDAALLLIELVANTQQSRKTLKEQAAAFDRPIIHASLVNESGAVGEKIYISGEGLFNVTGVSFYDGVAASFTVYSDSSISCFVPSGALTGQITLQHGTRNTRIQETFTVL